MRDPARIWPMVHEVGRLWEKAPDMRLGQLLEAAAAREGGGPDLFYIEDGPLMERLRAMLEPATSNEPERGGGG